MAELGGEWSDADQAVCLGGPLERVVDYMIERAGSQRPASEVMDLLLDAMEERLRTTPLEWRPGARALLSACLSSEIPTALVSASWARLIGAVAERIDDAVGRHGLRRGRGGGRRANRPSRIRIPTSRGAHAGP